MNAIKAGYRQRFASGNGDDPNFSSLSNTLQGSQFFNQSSFTPMGATNLEKVAIIGLDVTSAAGSLTFAGSGYLQTYGGDQNYAPLAGGQYSIPPIVPLNTSRLHEWQIQGTNSYVRLNVGGVEGHPDQMRVCWDIEAFGVSRATCTRHMRNNGAVVGADSINKTAGRSYDHVTNDDQTNPRRVHFCTQTYGELVNYVWETKKTYSYDVFQFNPPNLYRNRILFKEYVQGPNNPNVAGHAVTDVGSGQTKENLYNPRSTAIMTRRGNVVEAYSYSFGAPGGEQYNNEECSATENL